MKFGGCVCQGCGNEFEGDVVGGHRVLVGDATKAEDVERATGAAEPVLMVTDPPYGVDYDPKWRELAEPGRTGTFGGLRNPKGLNRFSPGVALGAVDNDDRVDWSAALALFRGDVAYVWFASDKAVVVGAGLEDIGFELRYLIIWNKQNHAISRGDYHWKHEPCWYAVRAGARSNWQGARDQMTVWDIKSINPVGGGGRGADAKVGHGTQKPVECMARPIRNNTRVGDVVYDPFLGSGTTLIAAEMSGRFCIRH